MEVRMLWKVLAHLSRTWSEVSFIPKAQMLWDKLHTKVQYLNSQWTWKKWHIFSSTLWSTSNRLLYKKKMLRTVDQLQLTVRKEWSLGRQIIWHRSEWNLSFWKTYFSHFNRCEIDCHFMLTLRLKFWSNPKKRRTSKIFKNLKEIRSN